MLRSVRARTAFHVTTLFAIPLVILVFLAPGSAQQARSKPDSSKQTKKYEQPTDASLYVGSEVCKTCHEDMPSKGFYKTYEDSPHFVTTLDTKKGPEWHGCEACHGPGKAHVDGGGDVTKIFSFKNAAPEETSARCLDCHRNREEQSNYSRSAHLQSGVACIDCHSPHNPKDSQFLLKESSLKLCYSCHLDVRAQFARPFHHRVNEGLIQCNDCHNPHGGFEQKQLRTAIGQDEVCYKCHADKQGPWVYQHEAKIEGCTVCHTPHGSTNQRMLKQNQVNLLCMSCHSLNGNVGPAATPTFHNQAQKYQACTFCHTAVHGSNSNRFFFTP